MAASSVPHPYSIPKLTFSQKIQFLQKVKENKSKIVNRFRLRAPRWSKERTWKSIALFLRQIGVVFDRDEVQTVKLMWSYLRIRTNAKLLRLQRRWKPFDPATALNEVERLVLELFGEYDPVKKTLADHAHLHPMIAPEGVVSATAPPATPISEALRKYKKMKLVDAGTISTSSYRMQNTEYSPKAQLSDSAGPGSIIAANDEFSDDLSKLVSVFTTEGEAKALLIPPTVNCRGHNRVYPFGLKCCQCQQSVAYLRSPGLWKVNDADGASQMDLINGLGNREFAEEWATLKSHIVRHHSNLDEVQKYRCDLCLSKFDCLEDFYRHSYRRLPSGYFCLICRCPFAGFSTIRVHLKRRHAVELELGNGSNQFQVKKCSVQPSRIVQKARLLLESKLIQEDNTDRKIESTKHADISIESILNKEVEPTAFPSVQGKDPNSKLSLVGSSSPDKSVMPVEIDASGLRPNLAVSRPSERNSVLETYDGVIVKKFVSATEAAEFGARIRTLCDGRPIGHTKTNVSWVFCGNCPVAESFRFRLIRWDNDLEETLFYYYQHVERCHSSLPLAYKCFVCGEGFADRKAYLSHAFRFPTSGYCCQRCGLTKSSAYFMRYHECEMFDSPREDFWHINRDISSMPDTPNCSNVVSNARIIRASSAREAGQYKCTICPKVYSTVSGFKYHNETKHIARNKPILGNGKAVKRKAGASNKNGLSGTVSKFIKTPKKPAALASYRVNNKLPDSPAVSSYSGYSGSDPGKSGNLERCAPVKRASQMSDHLFFMGNETENKLVENEPGSSVDNPDFKIDITSESPLAMRGALPDVPASQIKSEPCDAGLSSNVASDIVVANADAPNHSTVVPPFGFGKIGDDDCVSTRASKMGDATMEVSATFSKNEDGSCCKLFSADEIKIEPVDVDELELSKEGNFVNLTESADDFSKIWNGDECGRGASVKCEMKCEI